MDCPRLTKYLSATEHKELQVIDAMHLSTQSFDFWVERLCRCIGRPVVEVVQYIFFLVLDDITHGDDFPDVVFPTFLYHLRNAFPAFLLSFVLQNMLRRAHSSP